MTQTRHPAIPSDAVRVRTSLADAWAHHDGAGYVVTLIEPRGQVLRCTLTQDSFGYWGIDGVPADQDQPTGRAMNTLRARVGHGALTDAVGLLIHRRREERLAQDRQAERELVVARLRAQTRQILRAGQALAPSSC
jgi:hypothetical protein